MLARRVSVSIFEGLTTFPRLPNIVLDGGGVHLTNILRLEWLAIAASVEHAR